MNDRRGLAEPPERPGASLRDDGSSVNRRVLLAATGMATAAALAGCTDDAPGSTEEPTATPTDEPTGTPNAEPPAESLPTGSPNAPTEDLATLVAGNAGFAVDLHDRLAADDDADNVFVSPYSVSMALAMTYAGADGPAETAMRETLGFSLGSDTHPAFGALQDELDERETTAAGPGTDDDAEDEVDAFQLAVANALWGASEYPFDGEFLDMVDEHYGGGFNEADFATDHEAERERINEWVADATEERIDELLPEGSVDPATVLVLTNAIYFLASWRDEFDPDDTVDGTFAALDGTESTVPMMSQELRTNHADLPGARAIELPYVGEDVSMVLLVPDAGEFDRVVGDLTGSSLFGVFEALGDGEGELRMPRFEFEFDATLREALTDMGMGDAFGPGADFSGMVEGSGGPGIDEVYHEAFVSVDEEGTEAAAATATVMVDSAPPSWGELVIDRPFVFCIRDRPTDAVLFLGHVGDAGAAQS